METTVQTFIEMCQWDTAKFLIFSDNVFAPLVYYSHFFALITSFIIGLLVFLTDRKALINRILFLITTLFSLWVFADLVLWANEKPGLIMFFWSLQIIIEPLIYAACVYFIYVFVTKKDTSLKNKLSIAVFLVPTLLFASTKYALTGFDLTNCYRETGEGVLALYGYGIEVLYLLWILIFSFEKFRTQGKEEKQQTFFVTTGIILFLLSLVSGNIIGSLTENWSLAQAGLFGMPIFVGFLAYMIVRFKAFNVKLIATQVLMATIWLLVLGILMVRSIENVRVVTALTLILVTIAGDLLIKSVKKEIKQREQLAELIQQRESLVHLIDHKVKGSFTRSKYVYAGILDGTFGPISEEIKKRAEEGLDSNDAGIKTIDLVLNVANLQKGGFKYDMKTVDFREIVRQSIAEKKPPIEAKGLKFIEDIKEGNYATQGDPFWLKEVVNNFIDNAGKYTKEGSVTVGLSRKADPAKDGASKIVFSVKDSGMGITEEDKKILFTEGGRGKDSVKVNVDSTGYGLYSVKLIVEAHKGRVWAESEGAGKGSTFFVELNAVQG